MSDNQPKMYLSKLERQRFEALMKYSSIKEAALAEGTTPQMFYNWLYQFRLKYKKRRGWINSVLSLRRQSDFLKMILSERRPIEDVNEEDEE